MLSIPSELLTKFVQQGIEKGLLSNVQRTLDGESFLHESFIDKVIVKETQNKGKMSVDKLAEILNVEQSVIAEALERFQANDQYAVVDDLILTEKFVQDSFTELKEQINSNGFISIVAQTRRLGLPYSFLKKILSPLSEDSHYSHFQHIPDIIWTSTFIETCKSRIHHILKGSTDPVQMFKLQRELEIQEDLFYVLLEDVVNQDTSMGTIRGRKGRALFEPYSYRQRQFTMINSLYQSTHYLSYDTIKELYSLIQVEDVVKQVLSGTIEDSEVEGGKKSFYLLNTCVISDTIMKDTIDAIIKTEKLLSLKDVLPGVLSKEDISQVIDIAVDQLPKDKKVIVLDDACITTPETIQYIVDKSKDAISNHAIKLKQQNKYDKSGPLSETTVTKLIVENTEFKHEHAKLFTPFAIKQMNKLFADSIKTPYLPELKLDADPWVKTQREREFRFLCNQRQTIYFNYQSIQAFKDDGSKKKLERYVLKTQTLDFIYHLVLYLVLEQSFNKKEVEESISLIVSTNEIEQQTVMDDKKQKSAIDYFLKVENHQIDKTLVSLLMQHLEKKNLRDAVDSLKNEKDVFRSETVLDSSTTQIQFKETTHKLLKSQLESVSPTWTFAPTILHLISLLLFLRFHDTPLYVSGKFVPSIIEKVSPMLNQEDRLLICELQARIMDKEGGDQATVDEINKVQKLGLVALT